MKLLLDQGLPRSAADILRDGGHDVVHAGDVGLSTASDAEVLESARATDRAVVTLDADFHALLAVGRAMGPSVIRLRIEGLRGPAAATLIDRVIHACSDDLAAGAAVTVDEDAGAHRIRVHRLPLVRP